MANGTLEKESQTVESAKALIGTVNWLYGLKGADASVELVEGRLFATHRYALVSDQGVVLHQTDDASELCLFLRASSQALLRISNQ